MKTVVLFTGTVSTGKTTMLKALDNYFSGLVSVSIISEVIRDLIKKGILGKVDVGADNDNQIIITASLMFQFFEKLHDDKLILIAERSPIDTLAYSRHRRSSFHYINELNEQFLKTLFAFDKSEYNIICFYFPPILPFEEDNIRNKEGQKIIDNEIQKILKEFNINYITISDIDFNLRFNFVKDKILEVIN